MVNTNFPGANPQIAADSVIDWSLDSKCRNTSSQTEIQESSTVRPCSGKFADGLSIEHGDFRFQSSRFPEG